ncbi:MAG TPA: transcription antitermination factor NusB [Chitinophagaceae bacterium]|jgi:N utilization substance protein B|nr:transcription antitermination factor NusB [Chitinophagaceae bacterium]
MISRRNIRINVLQTIYETNSQESSIKPDIALKNLNAKFDKTNALYIATLQLLYAITQYVLISANQRASKMAPTTEDLNVNIKLSGNILIEQLKRNDLFASMVKKYKTTFLFEEETIKGLYTLLTQTSEYKAYIQSYDRTAQEEKKILDTIFDVCIYGNEDTAILMSELFMNWYNDYEMLYAWNDKMLMNIKGFAFDKIISGDKLEYAQDLVKCYYEKKELVFSLINPKLVNWDSERIASLDMIILHLGICEFLYFPTIPVKVTINEYIDLAKSYSTPQSGQFINGLLDNVRKDLEANQQLHKTQYVRK